MVRDIAGITNLLGKLTAKKHPESSCNLGVSKKSTLPNPSKSKEKPTAPAFYNFPRTSRSPSRALLDHEPPQYPPRLLGELLVRYVVVQEVETRHGRYATVSKLFRRLLAREGRERHQEGSVGNGKKGTTHASGPPPARSQQQPASSQNDSTRTAAAPPACASTDPWRNRGPAPTRCAFAAAGSRGGSRRCSRSAAD